MKNKKIDAISMIDERKLLLRYIRIQLFVFIVGTLLTITGICVSLKIFVFLA